MKTFSTTKGASTPAGAGIPCLAAAPTKAVAHTKTVLLYAPCHVRARAVLANANSKGFDALASSVFEIIPKELLHSDYKQRETPESASQPPLTVYSIRLATAYSRGAALSDPNSGVNIVLVGKEGKAIMHRISPVNDPTASRQEIAELCEVVDDSVGANCSTMNLSSLPPSTQTPSTSSPSLGPAPSSSTGSDSLLNPSPSPAYSYSLPSPANLKPKPRFQEGGVDEVSFLAPDLGPLAGVLVGTESGSWMLQELDVCSSRTRHMDRFVCREKLGDKTGLGAAWLNPVPPEAVVYGTGESAVVLSKEEAASMRSSGMADYADLKTRLLMTSLVLTAGGSGVASLVGGTDIAVPFALGGATGVLYQWLLQLGVDGFVQKAAAGGSSSSTLGQQWQQQQAAGTGSSSQAAALEGALEAGGGMSDVVKGVVSNPAVRLGFVAAAALAAASALHDQGLVQQAVESCEGVECMVGTSAKEGAWKLMVGVMGFMTYKVALVGVSLSKQESETARQAQDAKSKQYEKHEKYDRY